MRILNGSSGAAAPPRPTAPPAPATTTTGLTLLAFDDGSLPFSNALRTQLCGYTCGGKHDVVVPISTSETAPDNKRVIYYGSVCEVEAPGAPTEYLMFYLGKSRHDDPEWVERVCLATSTDAKKWVKPSLGLVPFPAAVHGGQPGPTNNNLVKFLNTKDLYVLSCMVIWQSPADEPDRAKAFKMLCKRSRSLCVFFRKPQKKRLTGTDEAGNAPMGVAFSADGKTWDNQPVASTDQASVFTEPSGLMARNGRYFVAGHGFGHAGPQRMMQIFESKDFVHWTGISCLGFRRGMQHSAHHQWQRGYDVNGDLTRVGEECHLGAALWDRGSCVLGMCASLPCPCWNSLPAWAH